MTVNYHASAHFDIDSEVVVEDGASSEEIWLRIVEDLEGRYGLEVSFESDKEESE